MKCFRRSLIKGPWENSLYIFLTVNEEVSAIVKYLTNRKATGYNAISPIVLKLDLEIEIDVLLYLINISMSTGVFPNEQNSGCQIFIQKVR